MYLVQTIYPLALASVNVTTGWLLYHFLDPVFGVALLVVGLLVVLSVVGRMVREYRPTPGTSV
ncbi:hypothetical protein N0B31_15690 [Salinirubellus salinus]|jgi:hypothetical protein|uniref:Uncharacterized protein n=1 Tax=Salinirubellus salinus TaxID=1364945 RepID=A0A9E7R2D8_9EURY|nr:hypothetical protein [Salinirubellus salinus]UWM53573.1 hypothetical protein N0B31_15690 [Salinirubellus salinus]